MTKITVNTITLDYLDIGEGEVLVLLHGLGSTKKDWDFQIPAFSKKYRLIVPDLRGHGNSASNTDFGVPVLTEDVFQLLTQLNISKASFIGFSMGGAIAFEMAYVHPQIVNKLIIVNSGPDFNNMGEIGKEMITIRTEFINTKGIKPLAEEIATKMFPETHQVDLRNEFANRCASNNPEVYLKTFLSLMEWGLAEKITTLTAPTLVVSSDMDYTPVAHKESYTSKMQNARLCIIKNSRHGVLMDQPKAFNEAVLNFLQHD
ncbi:alpha/beta fold hydrolase [Flavobacterium chuncheonense]|uniref:Alpha/beta fold hydrolase n=1 Tax=Flavobacterium chuncheonense TaxID=2026653 RepID=A0ABW5YNA7_9FLAO